MKTNTVVTDGDSCLCQHGISLRDWFAGQALSGVFASSADLDISPNQFAKAAYLLADTMLKERDIKRE